MLHKITPLHYVRRLGYHSYRGSVNSINQSINQQIYFTMLATQQKLISRAGIGKHTIQKIEAIRCSLHTVHLRHFLIHVWLNHGTFKTFKHSHWDEVQQIRAWVCQFLMTKLAVLLWIGCYCTCKSVLPEKVTRNIVTTNSRVQRKSVLQLAIWESCS